MSFIPLVRLWIWVSVFASAAGWTLSALGQLNRAGYGIALTAFILLVWVARRELGVMPGGRNGGWAKIRRRFCRPLPLCFAALAALILLGGVLYPPSNYTGLNYHLPRVLQWLAHNQWCWIHTSVYRMNYSGCAFEWITAPLLLFTKSDRTLFLVNFLPFLLLPGLIYSVFTRLGVHARVAWNWMWLLPTGYNFLLQSGSIGNDAFGAVYALAAIDFGCRAWRSRRTGDLWVSVLAIALMTGTKPVSLPLLLPWLVLVFSLLPWFRRHGLLTLLVLVLAGLASFLPMAAMNYIHSGDWLGRSVELVHKEINQPWIGFLGNTIQLLLGNLVPPVFPFAGWWNNHAMLILPSNLVKAFNANFEPGILNIGELPTEDWVGIGFGLALLLTASFFGSFFIRTHSSPRWMGRFVLPRWRCHCLAVAAGFAFLAYCAKSGLNTAPRLVTPYYLILIPWLLLHPAQSEIIRRRSWRWLSGGVLLLAFVVLILSPDRPLWPAQTILSGLHERYPDQRLIARALKVYTVYSQRNDPLAEVRALLPPDLKSVGFIGTADDMDISLWRPFGKRRVEHFLLTDSPEEIRRQVRYVVVGGYHLQQQGTSFEAWLNRSGAEWVGTVHAMVKINEGLQPWYVVRFKP
jgi:hypothetical protein